MSDLPFGPPVRVSPLIRHNSHNLLRFLELFSRTVFGRWSFLTAGILYGAFHQSRLSKKETKVREIEAKEKVIRDAKLKEEKARASALEMKTLEEMSTSKK